MKKIALFAFNGELMCFVHVLLNGLDMHEKGYETKIIFEGAATKLVKELREPGKPFANLYQKAKEHGLFEGTCKACSAKMGVLEEAKAEKLPLLEDLHGHPAISTYMENGYTVLTF